MGDMQLTELQDSVRFGIDSRTDISTVQLNRWINWSYLHIAQPGIHRHQSLLVDSAALVPLVLNQVEYDLKALMSLSLYGVYSVTHVHGTSATDFTLRRQRLRGPDDIRRFETTWQSQGAPFHYTIHGGGAGTGSGGAGQVLVVDRRPGSGEVGQLLLVRGYRIPTRLAASNSTTVLGDLWDEVISLGAIWRGWRALGRADRASFARADYSDMVNEVRDQAGVDGQDWGGRFEMDFTDYMVRV